MPFTQNVSTASVTLRPKMDLFTRITTEWPLVRMKIRIILHSLSATPFLTPTSSFNHGYEFPTNQGARRCSLVVEYGDNSPESRQGHLWYRTSSGRVWFCQRSSDNDQGAFYPLLRRNIPGSHSVRTQWPTDLTTLSSG